MAGVTPVFEPFVGTDEEIRELVISLNLERRDLTDAQRAMAAAKLANLSVGRPATTELIGIEIPINESPPLTINQAAEMMGVDPRQVKRAKVIVNQGVPELQDAVNADQIKIKPAERIARLPQAEQPAAIEAAGLFQASGGVAWSMRCDRITKMDLILRLEAIEMRLAAIEKLLSPDDSQSPTLPGKVFLTMQELSVMLAVKVKTIRQWRQRGNLGPKSIKIGGSVRYKLSTVNAWLATNERDPL